MAKGKKLKKTRKKKKLSQNRIVRILQNIRDTERELSYYCFHPNEFSSKTVGTQSQINSVQQRLESYNKKLCV